MIIVDGLTASERKSKEYALQWLKRKFEALAHVPDSSFDPYIGDTPEQKETAKMVWAVLNQYYPGNKWHVRVMNRQVFIRNLLLDGPWGMVLKDKDFSHDAAVFKREIIMKAGEWLERAGLARGINKGDEVKRFEGIPEKDQPKVASA